MKMLLTYIRHMLQSQYSLLEIKSLIPIICEDILGIDMIDLYTGKDINLSADNQQKLDDIIVRLLRHEPIQYIRGETDFCGFTFSLSFDVLIPRPETEELVNLVIDQNEGKVCSVLDIGTGSGCIAISINKLLNNSMVSAWDVSQKALVVAKENNKKLKAEVSFCLCDLFSSRVEQDAVKYDIIISNPPYVTETDGFDMQSNVLDYEPGLALFVPDNDPLRYYYRIAYLAASKLKRNGKLYFEINCRFGLQVVELLRDSGFVDVCLLKDSYGKDRFVIAEL